MRSLIILTLTVTFASSAVSHNSLLNFVPTVPDPMAQIIDGHDDDWGWFDQEAFGLSEWSAETYGGERVVDQDSDMQMLYLHAWSPPPDNAYYSFARVLDDTLRIGEGDTIGSWWNDDTLNVFFDTDHMGGNWVPDEEAGQTWDESVVHGYGYWVNPVFSNEVGTLSVPFEDVAGDVFQWQVDPPFLYQRTTIIPATTVNFTPNVEITFEVVLRTFDEILLFDIENSPPHVFEADEIIHISIAYEDGDWGPHGEDQIWHQPGATFAGNNFEIGTDNVLLNTTDGDLSGYPDSFLGRSADDCGRAGCDPVTGAGGTAVENTTWARIKSHLSK